MLLAPELEGLAAREIVIGRATAVGRRHLGDAAGQEALHQRVASGGEQLRERYPEGRPAARLALAVQVHEAIPAVKRQFRVLGIVSLAIFFR